MKLPSESKFQRWKFLELGRYLPPSEKHPKGHVTREQFGPNRPKIYEWSDVEEYRSAHGNLGLYSSVFHYDARDLAEATRLGSLYFDLDSNDGGALALDDARKLAGYLVERVPQEALRVYFTGAKGFHIECEAIALGIGPANSLDGLFRYIAGQLKDQLELTTLDFSVYDLRRMWRIPHSQHQKTGLFKVDLSLEGIQSTIEEIKSYAEDPHFEVEVPNQVFNARANEWYREWQYKQETKEKITPQQLLDRFNKYGSSVIVKDDPNSVLEFDPQALFEGCPALMKLWNKAEQEHDLDHEERLFLCSILSYTKESEWYLHQILSNCEDYNPEKSEAHIKDWVRRRELGIGGRPYSCERANSVGVGCGSCDLEPREKLQRVGDKLVKTGEFSKPSPIRYGYYRRKKDHGEEEKEWHEPRLIED